MFQWFFRITPHSRELDPSLQGSPSLGRAISVLELSLWRGIPVFQYSMPLTTRQTVILLPSWWSAQYSVHMLYELCRIHSHGLGWVLAIRAMHSSLGSTEWLAITTSWCNLYSDPMTRYQLYDGVARANPRGQPTSSNTTPPSWLWLWCTSLSAYQLSLSRCGKDPMMFVSGQSQHISMVSPLYVISASFHTRIVSSQYQSTEYEVHYFV